MAIRGKGTKYALKYVKIRQDDLRKQVIPRVADFCARKRAEEALTPEEYRSCLRINIERAIRGEELRFP